MFSKLALIERARRRCVLCAWQSGGSLDAAADVCCERKNTERCTWWLCYLRREEWVGDRLWAARVCAAGFVCKREQKLQLEQQICARRIVEHARDPVSAVTQW